MERIFVLDREQLAARPFSAIPRVDAPGKKTPPNASQPGSRTASKATATCMEVDYPRRDDHDFFTGPPWPKISIVGKSRNSCRLRDGGAEGINMNFATKQHPRTNNQRQKIAMILSNYVLLRNISLELSTQSVIGVPVTSQRCTLQNPLYVE